MTETGDGSKKDFGKARYDLIPPEALDALADLYGVGARKYADRGWETGMSWGRIFGAMMRHGWAWWRGETYDQTDGQHHLIAVSWCAFALFTYEKRRLGQDSRINLHKAEGFDPDHIRAVADRAPPACPDHDDLWCNPPEWTEPKID